MESGEVIRRAKDGTLPPEWERFNGRHAGLECCTLGFIGLFQVRGRGCPLELGVTSTDGPLLSLHVFLIPTTISAAWPAAERERFGV